ncbi:hypothetical protein [Sphingomonas sp. Leaf38]|uniref:hypothetical protein n=1 Tax=Sphingomonas sp. Leaf38 TaxID=1736217 RepID=UPI0012E1029F|nr:hypothetical protein [Sphingomonas sp. Leaf38]
MKTKPGNASTHIQECSTIDDDLTIDVLDMFARKLFDIQEDSKTKLLTRFITSGRQTALRGKAIFAVSYNVWKIKIGNPASIFFDGLKAAL